MGWHGNRKVSSVRSKNLVQIRYLINFFLPLLTSLCSLLPIPITIPIPIPMNVGPRALSTIQLLAMYMCSAFFHQHLTYPRTACPI